MGQKTAQSRLIKRLAHFTSDEDGAMLLLTLILFFAMTIFGGLAVDLANHERTRTTFQTHLDNAVLAAASLTQELDPEAVVMSYLTSAGLDPSLVDVETREEKIGSILVGRTVEATMPGGLNTYFFRFFDIDRLEMSITSQATERVEDIEISLVLDVSGSMAQPYNNPRLDLLKAAASDFVETILEDAEEGRVSISIVPYSTKVNAGEELLSQYTVTQEHNYSHCVDFDAGDYTRLAVDPENTLQRTGHFQFQGMDTWYRNRGEWVCRHDAGFTVTALSSSVDALKAQIAALTAEGSTSIDVGAKWGLALLDPSARAPVSALISSGQIEAAFRGRPHPYDQENSMKVLVLMTDGENFPEYRLQSEYASGKSDVIRTKVGSASYYNVDSPETNSENDGNHPNSERYFYATHSFGGEQRIWNDNTLANHPSFQYSRWAEEERLDWPEVWAEMSPDYYGYNLYGRRRNLSRWEGTGTWHALKENFWDNMHRTISPSEKDRRLREICAAANTAGIVVYSIGMDVESSRSTTLLKDCASTEAHYFDVERLEIQTAFDMIAASISMLRLTK